MLQQYDHPMFSLIVPNKAANKFVVVDPQDPKGLLYLIQRDYFRLSVSALANQEPLDVLLRPGENPVNPNPGTPSESPGSNHPGSHSDESESDEVGGLRYNRTSDLIPVRNHFTNSGSEENSGIRQYHTQSRSREVHNPLSCFSTTIKSSEFDFDVKELGIASRKLRNLIVQWGSTLSVRLGYPLMDRTTKRNLVEVGHYFEKQVFHEGIKTAVLRMKIACHVINNYLAGNIITCTRYLGAPLALTHGLPRFLPLSVRRQIRSRDNRAILLWVSTLALYKGVKYSSLPSYETISSPPPEILPVDSLFVRQFWDYINPKSRRPEWGEGKFLGLMTSGPNASKSILSTPFDAYAWSLQPVNHLKDFLIATGQKVLLDLYDSSLDAFRKGRDLRTKIRLSDSAILRRAVTETPVLGRLSLKQEPAGKVRVFAIVDGLTQSALKPLHDWIFSILKGVPSDATFNQIGSVVEFAKLHSRSDVYSFDLSSATDLIPFKLTLAIMNEPLGKISHLWGSLLVDRSYLTPDGEKLRYTRGQPIGALSSWSALAITHHWVVQEAARRVGTFPFSDYLVLGDDISISGKLVADSYVEVCKDFSIPINQKGIVSLKSEDRDSLVNFANQVICGDNNYSPIQIREELAVSNVSARAEALSRLVLRGIIDYNSPKFLPTCFRHSVVTTRQIEMGRKLLSRGLLPVGFSEVLTFLLHPSTGKSWLTVGKSSLPYVYLRHLAGLNILGGWNYHSSHPDKLIDTKIPKRDLYPSLLVLVQHIWTQYERILTNHVGFLNHVRGKDPQQWQAEVLLPLKSDLARPSVRMATYALALDGISLYFKDILTKYERFPFLGGKVGDLVDSHTELISFLYRETDEFNIGEFVNLLYDLLVKLDDTPLKPQFYTGYQVETRPLSKLIRTEFVGEMVTETYLPHHPEFARTALCSGNYEATQIIFPKTKRHVDAFPNPGAELRMDIFDEIVLQTRRLNETPRSIRLVRRWLRDPLITKLFGA